MEDLLPAELMIDILSRLPVKAIFHCKCVCKKWWNLVMDSSFVHLHLSRSPTTIIIHHESSPNDPGVLEWVEIQDKDDCHHLHHDPLMSLHLDLAPILQKYEINLVGSVNGLICLLQASLGPNRNDDNIYICNLVTREYMILHRRRQCKEHYDFGMSSMTREYKVIRIIKYEPSVAEAQVYTLGTGQWRSLGHLPYQLRQSYDSDGSFLNGHCHWILYDTKDALCTFDFDKETFQLFPSPPLEEAMHDSEYPYECLAIIKGYLCKMDFYESQFTIWVMKECGIKESWHKEVVINQAISPHLHWPLPEPLYLIEGLKDGSILTLCDHKLWEFYPKNKTIQDTGLFYLCSFSSALAYRPSFLKLQNFELERVHMF